MLFKWLRHRKLFVHYVTAKKPQQLLPIYYMYEQNIVAVNPYILTKKNLRRKTANWESSSAWYIYQYLPSCCGRMSMPKEISHYSVRSIFIHPNTIFDRKNNNFFQNNISKLIWLFWRGTEELLWEVQDKFMVWEVDHKYIKINNNNLDKYHPILGKKSIKIETPYQSYKSKDFKQVKADKKNIQGLSSVVYYSIIRSLSETQADILHFKCG